MSKDVSVPEQKNSCYVGFDRGGHVRWRKPPTAYTAQDACGQRGVSIQDRRGFNTAILADHEITNYPGVCDDVDVMFNRHDGLQVRRFEHILERP